MTEEESCEYAFDQFIKNHEAFLALNANEHPEIACEMILLEVCATMHLLDKESLEQFFRDICNMKENLSREFYEDEPDFLDCVNRTMESIRDCS